MGERITKHFPGSATLEETARACEVEVIDGLPKELLSVEAVNHNGDGGTSQNVNEVIFEVQDSPLAVLSVLNDFVLIDVSTPQGAADAAAASNGRKKVGGPGAEFRIWVENELVPVQILGKHV